MPVNSSSSPIHAGRRLRTRGSILIGLAIAAALGVSGCSSGDGDEAEETNAAAVAPVAETNPVPEDAGTGLRVCNGTESSVGVAVGYDDEGDLVSEGWWNLSPRGSPNECAVVITGALRSRYYYVYAIDYTLGGEWGGDGGDIFMCTRDQEFTIRGIEDCVARGYDRAGFVQIDTGDRTVHNVQLTVQQGIGGR